MYQSLSQSSASSSDEIVDTIRDYLEAENTDDEERINLIWGLEELADEEVTDALADLAMNEEQDVELLMLAMAMELIDDQEAVEVIEEIADIDLPLASAWAELEEEGAFEKAGYYSDSSSDRGRKSVYEQYDYDLEETEESVEVEKLHPLLGNLQLHGESSEEDEGRLGIFRSIWNLLNDIIGASVVSVPYFVIMGGFYPGLALLFIYGVICLGTLMLLHNLIMKRSLSSYTEMSYLAFGVPGVVLSAVFMILFNFGGFVGNCLLLGQLIDTVLKTFFPETFGWFNFRIGVLVGVALLSPLAFFKSLKQFATISMLSVLAVFFLIGVVIFATASNPVEVERLSPDYGVFMRPAELLQAMGGIGYLFACHDLAFHVVHTLEKPTTARYGIVASVSMLLTGGLFAAISFCTKMAFEYNDIHANLLENYVSNDTTTFWIVNLCRMAMILNIAISVPYCVYMPRVATLSLIQLKAPYWVLRFPDNTKKRNVTHVIVTLSILGLAIGLAISGIELDAVFGLSGGLAGISIAIIIPMLSWLKIREKNGEEGEIKFCFKLSTSIFFILLGLITSTVVVISYIFFEEQV
eukprot:TRINITY_DN1180_c0_g1_i4.p1 TRINITY_DN1180_c0_g1~~TRINITY_DN1180_c0_g1_i4.p1  ORF type:complete len:581 (+),score=113.70 TRINITY_DN1180_c0_g1_i4:743-2485(+)